MCVRVRVRACVRVRVRLRLRVHVCVGACLCACVWRFSPWPLTGTSPVRPASDPGRPGCQSQTGWSRTDGSWTGCRLRGASGRAWRRAARGRRSHRRTRHSDTGGTGSEHQGNMAGRDGGRHQQPLLTSRLCVEWDTFCGSFVND